LPDLLSFFFLSPHRPPPYLHSFPTRRSSDLIYEQGLGENVFIIWKNDDVYSTGIKDTFVAKAEELGLTVVGDATFTEDSQTDFTDRKSTRLNSSHVSISYAVFCLKKKKQTTT